MNWLIVKNDFKRNKVINISLFMFMMFSSCLAVLSVIMAVQTFTSISQLYKKADPPHFVQMHKGELNQNKIDDFMMSYEGITYWQTQTMIDVYGENITVVDAGESYSLVDLRLDIGLVKQNEKKDLLLNSKHEKVTLVKGEIGMPVILKEMYNMEIGHKIVLNSNGITKEFIIKEFILDSMMNSTMTSSTRILLSDEDFNVLVGQVGENEFLIEAYFTDKQMASDFQTSYENANLPKNGQAITYTIIFILSALTDIATVFVMLLVSILLIIISFICVRFTIMAALEEEIREIGTMKAIGISFSDIREIYLNKYRILAAIGVIVGYVLSLFISNIFTQHISTTFGDVRMSFLAIILSLVVGYGVYLLICLYCKKVLKKIKKITVVDSLVNGNGYDKHRVKITDGLYKSTRLSANSLIGTREVFYKFKSFLIIFAVAIISEVMILIPVNLMNTFEAPEFITYMGSSMEDILIEVENGANLENNYMRVKEVLKNETEIKNYLEYRRVSVQTTDVEDELVNLHIDSGVNSGGGLQYLIGYAPKEQNEIAISYLNAEKIGKNSGDIIKLLINSKEQEFVISGIYQDVTSGGYTAKSQYAFTELESERYSFSVNLKDNQNVIKKTNDLSEKFGAGVTVDPMEEFINQTLGGVVKQLKTVVFAVVIIGVSMEVLITVLFLKLRLAKDLSDIAILKAIGFTEKDIKIQYLIKIALVSLVGLLVGIVLTDVLGEKVVNAALSVAGIGVKQVELISNWLIQYIICPLLLLSIICLVTWIVLKAIKKYNIITTINE